MNADAHADRGAGRLVIVDGAGASPHRWQEALAEFRPEIVATVDEAADVGEHDVVIVDLPALGDRALAAILEAFAGRPSRRVLTADHGELAGILRTGVNGLFHHIVPRAGSAANVRTLVAGLRAPAPAVRAVVEPRRRASWASTLELLRWTVSQMVGVPGVVIRSYQPQANKLEVQFVAHRDRDFESFHCELPRRWRWPVRARAGEAFTQVGGERLSAQSFGEIERDQEIYVLPLDHAVGCAYLALLPWTKDGRITIALGVWLDDAASDEAKQTTASAVSELHAQAVREVAQFTLPALDDAVGGVRYLLDYNWVVTQGYAGPDRRKEDTSLVNRYMLVGRRKTVAKSLGERVGGFVDGAPSWVASYFLVYVVLATIDTFCTSRFVSAGSVVELNPLLAPLITHRPWLFLLTKNVLAVGAFAIIVRFHLFRRAKHVLRASIGAYAVLDVYWAIILVRLIAH